ncbi:retrovirus-related pol polyprotein from transposon TNT 1-94 [Tanacetum coccineum]
MASPAPQDRWSKDKHIKLVNIIGNPGVGMLIRAMAKELSAASDHECLFVDFLSEEEPKKVFEARKHPRWVDAMQEELNQFSRNKVCIDYDETFAPVARLKAIRIFLAFATYMNFIVYQRDVKSAFLNGKLKEVYVKKPPGFESSEFPNHVFRLDKTLYGHKQSPRAWYLKGTPSLGLWYPKCLGFNLKGYSDSDYVGCNMNRKSTSCACELLRGKLMCWSAKKQQSIAMSPAEAEYVVVVGCCANILWMKSQLSDYDIIYEKLVAFKAPRTSSKAEKKVAQEVAKGVSSSKGDTGSQTGHSLKETQSSSAKDLNPSQPPTSTLVVAGIHKEFQQATSGPISLGVTGEEGAHPQLSSVVSTSLSKPIYLASTILHSESASRHDASTNSTSEVDLEKSAPHDSISQQQGMDKGTQNYSIDHIIAVLDLNIHVEKTKFASERLETVLTKPATGKGAIYIEKEIEYAEDEFNTSSDLSNSDNTKKEIKVEDLSKLVPNLDVDFMDLDSPENEQPIIVEDEEAVHAEKDDAKRV